MISNYFSFATSVNTFMLVFIWYFIVGYLLHYCKGVFFRFGLFWESGFPFTWRSDSVGFICFICRYQHLFPNKQFPFSYFVQGLQLVSCCCILWIIKSLLLPNVSPQILQIIFSVSSVICYMFPPARFSGKFTITWVELSAWPSCFTVLFLSVLHQVPMHTELISTAITLNCSSHNHILAMFQIYVFIKSNRHISLKVTFYTGKLISDNWGCISLWYISSVTRMIKRISLYSSSTSDSS